MELVKGIPLNDYCDQHKLSIRDRLQLFMHICSAVQHAHQKGIIHRDLKPTNILVENHDDKPVPKVIDFGLAKATSGLQLSENTLFTAFGSVMGTPLYMAPEQANFSAVDVDTRADVYALGVILYELLTGTTPITRESMKKAALDEMLKLIREQDAPTPSSRLSTSESKPSIAANRQMEPQKLGRLIKGELGYRLRKFVKRNRGQVIAASLILCSRFWPAWREQGSGCCGPSVSGWLPSGLPGRSALPSKRPRPEARRPKRKSGVPWWVKSWPASGSCRSKPKRRRPKRRRRSPSR